MLEMPVFEYIGDEYQHGLLEKVAIDWSKQFIRGSLKVKPENNHPNIKKKEQRQVVFFAFGDVGKTLRHLTPLALDEGDSSHFPACD
jgi:hypothetical protein